jgi:hypothetical protein
MANMFTRGSFMTPGIVVGHARGEVVVVDLHPPRTRKPKPRMMRTQRAWSGLSE